MCKNTIVVPEPLTLLVVAVMTLLVVGFLALLIFYTRSGRSAASPAAKSPAEGTAQRTGKVTIPPRPFVEGGDDEEVTDQTLAVSGTRPFLRKVSGPSRSKESCFLSPTGVTTIGRAHDNDIVISEGAASFKHCQVEKQGNAYVLIDLGSTNKTWVNGSEKGRVVLHNGDKLTVGETTMIFALFGDRT